MDTVLKSDIFFFITSIAVIIIGVVSVVALIYIIRILRDVKEVSGHVKEESEKWKHVLSMIGALFSGGSEKGRTRKSRNTNKELH